MPDIFDTLAAPASSPPPPSTTSTGDIFDQLATPKSATNPQSGPSSPGFFQNIYQGVRNIAANQAMETPRVLTAASDVFHGDWHDAQKQARDLFLGAAVPEMQPSSFQAEPNPEYPSNAGLWAKTKAVAGYPILGTFHRKGSGPIEGEVEGWLSGQVNPLNVGIAAATAGSGLVEGALVKAGVGATRAAGIVHAAKTAANLGFLASQGISLGKSVPVVERDYDEWKAARGAQKQEALDRLERDSTDLTLSSLATGLATHGVESDLAERAARSPRGRAMAVPDYADGIHDYQSDVQKGNAQAQQFAREETKAVPDSIRREGITNAIEAQRDPFTLAQREIETAKDANPERAKQLAKGYAAAQNLNPNEVRLLDRINRIHSDYLGRLQDAGLLPEDGPHNNPGAASPIQVYHGTSAPVSDISELSAKFSRNGLGGKGVYLSESPAVAGKYGGPEGVATGGKVLGGLLSGSAKLLDGNAPLPESLQKIAETQFSQDVTGTPKSYLDWVDALQSGIGDVSDFQREMTKAGFQGVKYVANYPGGPRAATMLFGEDVGGKPVNQLVRPTVPSAAPLPAASGYIHHAYNFEDVDPATGEPTEATTDSKAFLRKRVFPSYFEAERAGFDPKNKDAVALTADYQQKANAVLAKQGLADSLSEGQHTDGSPLSAAGGIVAGNYVVPDVPRDIRVPQADLQRLQANGQISDLMKRGRVYQNDDGTYSYRFSDYKDVGLKASRFIGNDEDGRPMFARVPVYVHPDVAEHLRNVLDQSAPTGIIGAALKASGLAKSALLALSPFHWDTIINRGLEAGGGHQIFHPRPVDYFNLTDSQQAALRDGLAVTNTRPTRSGFLESEGLSSGGSESTLNRGINSALKKIGLDDTWAARLNINGLLEDKLFGANGYITRMKFQTYDTLKPEIMRTYPNLTEEQAGRIAASQVNSKFGGLNYTLLGRSVQSQSFLRALTLAPDFLESTGRSMLDTIGPYGKPLLKRFIQFQAAHYLLARVANFVSTGDLHPESGFSVLSPDGKKEYNLRTTLGDFLHFVKDPRDFAYNRLNPLLVRTPLEAFYGVDQYGRRLSDSQRETSIAREITPLSLQGPLSKVLPSAYGNQGVAEPSASDQLLKSFGVGATAHLTPAENLAFRRMSAKTEGGEPLEGNALVDHQQRFRLEDGLRSAHQTGDAFDVAAADQAISAASKGDNVVFDPAEARAARKDARLTRLQSTVKHLPLPDALDVWDQAGAAERQSLNKIIFPKIVSWQKRASRTERDAMQPRLAEYKNQARQAQQ
jgi:hypothetical protein